MVYYFYYSKPEYERAQHVAVSCNKAEIEKNRVGFNRSGFKVSQIFETRYKSFVIE